MKDNLKWKALSLLIIGSGVIAVAPSTEAADRRVTKGSTKAAAVPKKKSPLNAARSSLARAASPSDSSAVLKTPAVPAPVNDRVVASIDGEPVTISDLQPLYRLRAESPGAPVPADGPVLRRLVQEYVDLKLIEREAQALNQSVTDEEMNTYVDEVLKQNNVDRSGFEKMLTERGMTLDGYRAQIRAEILRSRVIGNRLRSKVAVSDRDISKYVGEQPQQAAAPEGMYHLEQIFIPKQQELSLTGEENSDAQQAIEGIAERIGDGEDFVAVGGKNYVDLGEVTPDDLINDIREQARSLDENEVSDVISGEKGFYILRRLPDVEHEKSEQSEISDELKNSVRKELTEERSKGEIERYMSEELPKKYNVEIKL